MLPEGKRIVPLSPEDGPGSGAASGRQFIAALSRGLDVLRAFREDDPPLSNQELARRTGLPRPTISRITYTLTELGYLIHQQKHGCYELGGRALALGYVARANFNIVAKVRPAMQRLAEFSGANVGLGARDKLSMVYLETVTGPSLIGLRLNVGVKIPLLTTAMGCIPFQYLLFLLPTNCPLKPISGKPSIANCSDSTTERSDDFHFAGCLISKARILLPDCFPIPIAYRLSLLDT